MSGNLICDLDGVVWRGGTALPGSAEAIKAARAAQWNVIFCTNNSSRPPAAIVERLEEVAEIDASPEQVATSAQAAALLLGDRPLTFILGGEGIDNALAEAEVPVTTDPKKAQAVVVGLDPGLTYARLRDAVIAVREGARLIATNLDPTFPVEGGLWPGAGSIVAAVETAAGCRAEPAGKPHRPMRDLLRSRLKAGETWVVGDRADTDLAMAAAEPGWRGALVGSSTGLSDPAADFVAPDLAGVVREVMGR
ncbi:MAG TPA: HAD-IIA family hydrolase [Acidimicrobiia bacterium]